jgi:hypothetical protein
VAIKAGQIIHDAQGFVVDRIQTGGVSNLNIPEEKIYELGNFFTVATIRDIPDLSFDLESLDVSTEDRSAHRRARTRRPSPATSSTSGSTRSRSTSSARSRSGRAPTTS